MKTFNQFGVAAIVGAGLFGGAVALSSAAAAAPFPMGGPVCVGGAATFIDPAGGAPAAAPALPCGPESADLTTLAGPMAFPGPLPAAPVVPLAPPVPVLPPPVPVVPGGPPPVPFVAPGPAGAAAASPIAGVLVDAAGLPVNLAAGSK